MSFEYAFGYIEGMAVLADKRLEMAEAFPSSQVDKDSNSVRDEMNHALNERVAELNQNVTSNLVKALGGKGLEIERTLKPDDFEAFAAALLVFSIMPYAQRLDIAKARKVASNRLIENYSLLSSAVDVSLAILEQAESATSGNPEFGIQKTKNGSHYLFGIAGFPTIQIQGDNKHWQHQPMEVNPDLSFVHYRDSYRNGDTVSTVTRLATRGYFNADLSIPRQIVSGYTNVTEIITTQAKRAFRLIEDGKPVSEDDIVLAIIHLQTLGKARPDNLRVTLDDPHGYTNFTFGISIVDYATENGIEIVEETI